MSTLKYSKNQSKPEQNSKINYADNHEEAKLSLVIYSEQQSLPNTTCLDSLLTEFIQLVFKISTKIVLSLNIYMLYCFNSACIAFDRCNYSLQPIKSASNSEKMLSLKIKSSF